MKKSNVSLLVSATLSATLLLSACGENTANQAPSSSTSEENTIFASDLASQAKDSAAHWLRHDLLMLPKSDQKWAYQLVSAEQGAFDAIMLLETNFPAHLANKFPHLADFQAYKVNLTPVQVKQWIKNQTMVMALNTAAEPQHVSFVQTSNVIDALYTEGENDANEVNDLGATLTDKGVSFKVWAPTAQQVDVLLFDKNFTAKASPLPMTEDVNTGVWSIEGNEAANGDFYQYQVTVYHPETKKVETLITTDPYSLSLSVNSIHSQVVDLNDETTQPAHWKNHHVPSIKNVEDNIFYETHIRDFSSDDSALSNTAHRGKYKAFGETDSYGIKHLKALKKAGLNNIHLLPVYDIGTVDEDQSKTVSLDDTLAEVKAKVCDTAPTISVCIEDYNDKQTLKALLESFDINGKQTQKVVSELRTFDNFNWGYDPFHYTVPEGSYAVNPEGKTRLVEFREMVQNIHGLGFRVIMDVVYNHTYQFGLKEKSVLDKVVPHYYHRLNTITGKVAESTCYTCGNTATERVMMAKLMTDSLVTWARDYKIDGFRFDLMGHQPKEAMLVAREAVRQVDSDTYFYGEGWNFAEVKNNSLFTQASQLELGGTEIGTYTDRLRDAVRGGGNNNRDSQGVGNGLLTLPNEKQSSDKINADYELRMDQQRIGLVGNLVNFPLRVVNGTKVLGKDIPYGDQPTGYALDPADTINYVSKHDNQTLWDNSQYRLAFDVSTDDRVRLHLQSLALALYAQGIPFIHMGSEFMRSKSFLRDSYDYSDWFNRVDFSKQTNYYNVGLPPADKDQENWPLIQTVMKGHEGRDHVTAKHIQLSSNVFEEMLTLRMSTPLFRLTSSEAIIEKISFLNSENTATTQPGLLVMKIDDTKGKSVDERIASLIVIFNTGATAQQFNYAKSQGYQLHPVQQKSVDVVVKQAKVTDKGFSIPPLSSVVFVKYK